MSRSCTRVAAAVVFMLSMCASTVAQAPPFAVATGTMVANRQHQAAVLLNDGRVLLIGGNGLNSAEVYDPSTGAFSATAGAMSVSRENPTATLLSDGTVLVTGGDNGAGGAIASAEIFDPARGSFTATAGNMNVARLNHVAVLLADGKVLIAGGSNVSPLNSAELYDPASKTFTALSSTMTAARNLPTAVTLTNGKVFIANGSGSNGGLASTDIYDPATRTFSAGGSTTSSHYLGTATVLKDGRVLVAGGPASSATADILDATASTTLATANMSNRYDHCAVRLPDGRVVLIAGIVSNLRSGTMEVYDPASNSFSNVANTGSLITPRYLFSATLLNNGDVLVAGGSGPNAAILNTAELLTPFQSAGNLTTARAYHTSTLLNDGTVLLAGGYNSGFTPSASAAIFTANGTTPFAATGSLTTARAEHTASLLADGRVLLAGGYVTTGPSSSAASATTEIYNPSTASFIAGPSMVSARADHTATVLQDGRILFAGGYDANGVLLSSAELYDPTSNTFSSVGTMNAGRAYHTATLLQNGTVLITGGYGASTPLQSAEIFDPSYGGFSAVGNMSTARSYHSAVLLNNGKVLVSGGYSGAALLSSTDLYDPTAATFSAGPALAAARDYHSALLLTNGHVIVVGGVSTSGYALTSAEDYDPVANTFSGAGTMLQDRSTAGATLLTDGRILLTGGVYYVPNTSCIANFCPPNSAYRNTAETFTPGTLVPANMYSISVTPNGSVVALGGQRHFVAIGNFYNTGRGYYSEILGAAQWSSNTPSVATITNDDGNRATVYGLVGDGSYSYINACTGSICGTTYVYSVQPNADVQVTVSGPTQTANSTTTTANITYTIRNNGPYIAKSVNFNATVDYLDGATLASYNPAGSSTGPSCSADGNLYCSLGDMEPGASLNVTLQFTYPGVGNFPSTGTASTATNDPTSSNNSASLTTAVPVAVNLTFAGSGEGDVVSTPAGINCYFNCTAYFPVGTQVTLAMTPRGSLFSGWSGGCSGTAACTFTMGTTATAVTATLVAASPTAVIVSPAAVGVTAGGITRFAAIVTGSVNGAVTWAVNGVVGGNSTVGTISTAGVYTAPSSSTAITVTATAVADTSKVGSAAVSITQNPVIAESWGRNLNGQLGNGNSGANSYPAEVLGLSNITKVSAGYYHSLFLRYDGTVWALGDNEEGQLGNGTTNNTAVPVQASGLSGVTAVSAGGYHSLALKSDGSVWGWGYNYDGELGSGSTGMVTTPVQTSISGVTAIAAGYYASIVLKSDGTVWAFGTNSYGLLGQSNTSISYSATPLQIVNLTNVTAIAIGYYHGMALKSDGTVWTWGYNAWGQLGDGTTTASATPIQVVGLSGVTAIAAGYEHSLALKSDGTVWAWGNNGNGQFGNNTTTSSGVPVQVSGLSNAASLTAGAFNGGVIKTDGTIWAWGYNGYGQLGVANNNSSVYVPTQVQNISSAIGYAQGYYHTLMLRSDGLVFGDGYDYYGELGVTTNQHSTAPVIVTGLSNLTAIAGGQKHSMAARNDGAAFGWGDNSYGALGDGTTTTRLSPAQVSGLTGAVSVVSGYLYSAALRSDGTVWTWGYNEDGELGNGGTNYYTLTPAMVPNLSNIIAIAGGYYHMLALKSDGTLWAWGYNGEGELGTGNTNNAYSPVQVVGLSGIVSIAAGSEHSIALKSDGTVWDWGYNYYGELGNGTSGYYNYSTVPVRVTSLANMLSVASGYESNFALASDGTVYGWGYGGDGELGNGSYSTSSTPVHVSNLTGVTAIAAGEYHTMALKNDRSVWTWGYNGDGELGDGTFTTRNAPVRVVNMSGAIAIAAGDYHSLALVDAALTSLDHFSVSASTTAPNSGNAFSVIVTARDTANNVVGSYTGTVHFTLSSPDGSAVIPADYTFVTSDSGSHTFSFTLNAAGTQTINVSDTVQTTSVGGTTVTVQNASGADIAVTTSVVSGSVITATVTNNGPTSASIVTFTDKMDRYVATGVAASQGSCNAVPTSTLTCVLGTLASGASATVTVTTLPPSGGWASQSFHASAAEFDPNPANNSVYVGPNVDSFNTEVGSGIIVNVADPASGLTASVTFSSITRAGSTTVSPLSGLPEAPSGFRSKGIVFDLSTSATYTGAITITVPFAPSSFRHPTQVHLFHLENGVWVDRTKGVANAGVVGATASLSPFALFEPVDVPPVASAGTDRVVSGALSNGASVALDGSASSDADGDALTYRWSGPFGEGATASGIRPNVTLPFGTSKVTLIVNDGEVDSPAVTMNITVSDFGLTAPAAAASMARGQSATFSVNVGARFGAFNAPVALACSTSVPGVTCSTASSIVPGSGGADTAVTVNATALARSSRPFSLGWLAIMIGPLGLTLSGSKRRTRLLLLVMVLLAIAMVACGGGGMNSSSTSTSSSSSKPATTVTVTISGTSGAIQHNSTFNVTVQ